VTTIGAVSTNHTGFTVWVTGISAAGKTTVADLVAAELDRRGILVERLDGDIVRRHLTAGLGFDRKDRDTNVLRVAWVASRLTRAGAAVVVSLISPYAETRGEARELVEEHGRFVEVFADASLETCIERDPKGLYAKALRGEIQEFTAVSDPYEAPEQPEVHLHTDRDAPDDAAAQVLAYLEDAGLAPRA
jgi:adenylyl-sulfate kinase